MTTGAPEVAVAYVSIVPEIQGFAADLRRQIAPASERAGDDAGEGFASGFKAKALAGATAVGAAFVKFMGDAIDQSNATSKLKAQLGATSKDAAKYGKVSGQLLAKGVVDNFEEGAETIRAVVNAGLVPPDATNKQLESIAAKMADVSHVFGTDMSMQTQAVSAMLKNGLAKNADEALDVITVGMQRLGPNAEDLLETFQEYPVQLRKLGLDSQVSLGLFSQGLQAGARDTDILADALKEFSIRAIDGSKGTADGYKALGLDADDMAARVAKGGKSASGALDTVLDRLRGMKDPVKRSQAAVALFGTQAEDLGAALFALDPSKAVGAMGKVGGAASKLGKTIHSGGVYEFQTFIRTLQQRLVQALVDYAVPALMGLVDGVKAVAQAASGAWDWLTTYGPWLAPFAVAIGGIALALNAQAIATGAVTLVMGAYRAVMLTGIAVTQGMAAAMALLNTITSMNVFVLVAIAIAALVAGLIVAYNKVGWFRAGVQAAFKVIGDVASWLWKNAIKPAFDAIMLAAKVLLTFLTIVVFYPIYLAVKALGKLMGWLWTNAFKPSLEAIGKLAGWLWRTALKPQIDSIVSALKTLGGWGKWLYEKAIQPAFKAIGDTASWLWKQGVKPQFDAMRAGVKKVGDAFATARDYIGDQWSKVAAIARKPVQIIVDTVYNHGIVGVWNRVASAFGAPKLSTFKFASGGVLPGYTPGRDPHKFYSPSGMNLELSGGESIMRPEFTRAVGSGFVHKMNGLAKSGGVSAVRNALGGDVTQRFANGGIFSWVGKQASRLAGVGSDAWNTVKKGASWLTDTLGASARAGVKSVVNPLIAGLPADNAFARMAKRIPNKIIDSLFGFADGSDKKLDAAGIGGKGTQKALNWARTQNGKPYEWGGNGNPSWDCSGFMSAIESVIRGQAPHRRWATGSFSGNTAPAGWVRGLKAPFMIGVTNAGVGHTAGTINGVNVESRGGDGVIVGPRARSYKSSLFTDQYGFMPSKKYDSGGWLMPGASMNVNETGRPEPVLTSAQWSNVSTLAARGMAGGIKDGDTLYLSVDGRTTLKAYVGRVAGEQIDNSLIGPASLGRTL